MSTYPCVNETGQTFNGVVIVFPFFVLHSTEGNGLCTVEVEPRMGIEKFPEDVGELEQEGKEQKDKWCPLVVGDLCILKRDQKKVNIQERTLKPIHS